MMVEAALVKAENLEVLARRSLVADSARLKVAISRRVGEIVARLDDPSVPVRSAAQGLGALVPILKLLYRWHEEPSLEEMKHAESPLHNMINLELINTPPEKLRELAEAKLARENGSRETVHKARSDGTLVYEHEGASSAGDGQLTPQKVAPPTPAKQPETSSRTGTHQRVEQAVQGNPPSSQSVKTWEASERPPGWHEHRRACRLKYG